MNRLNALIAGCLMAVLAAQPAFAAVDREKLLNEAGVFGTLAVFKVDDSWWKLDKATRTFAATEVKAVFQKHGDNIITDTHLLRGLTGKADFFVQVHSNQVLQSGGHERNKHPKQSRGAKRKNPQQQAVRESDAPRHDPPYGRDPGDPRALGLGVSCLSA